MVGMLQFLEKFDLPEKAVPLCAGLARVLAAVLFKNLIFSHHAYSFLAVKINTEGKRIVNECEKIMTIR